VTATAAELFRRGLRDHRRALAGWCGGIVAYSALIAAIFPSIEGSADFTKLVESYPDALKSLFGLSGGGDIGTGSGFVDAELFSFMLPLLAIVLSVGSAARTLAGEEDAGRLELVLAYPVRRRDAVLAKGAAVGLEVAALCAAGFAALLALDPVFDLELPAGRLAAALAGVGAIGIFYGWLALAVAAWRPGRALAIGIPAAAAAGGYLVGGLQELAGWLSPFRFLSPFWWVGQAPLRNGVDGWGVLVVLLAAAFALGTASLLLERRDLQTP
jgi:ABC-2 type transport system permease protein